MMNGVSVSNRPRFNCDVPSQDCSANGTGKQHETPESNVDNL